MWDLPRSGREPMSSILSGKFFTNEPLGKLISFVFVRAAIIKCHRMDGLNNRSLYSHCFGGWKSKTKMLVGVIFLWSLSRVCGWLPSHCVFMWSFVHKSASLTSLYVSKFPFLTRTTHIGLGPTLMPSLQLRHLYQGTVFKSNHILRYWELGLQHINFGGIKCSPFTPFYDFPTNFD